MAMTRFSIVVMPSNGRMLSGIKSRRSGTIIQTASLMRFIDLSQKGGQVFN